MDVCNFDAIEMSHEHELSKYQRNGNRVDLDMLLDMGKKYQADTGWRPTNPIEEQRRACEESRRRGRRSETTPAEPKQAICR